MKKPGRFCPCFQTVFPFLMTMVIVEYLSVSAIPSRLYGVGYFCCSQQTYRQEVFFEKGLRPATLLRKRVWHRCFPANFVKFPRTPFLTEHLWWPLLAIPGRLFRVKHFCCSEQVIPSRRFLLFRVGYIWSRAFVLCYSEQVILSRTFLLFQVGYTKKVFTEQKFSAILFSLNQLEHFDDPKKLCRVEILYYPSFWHKFF